MPPTIATDAEAAATQRETLADIIEDGEAAVLRFQGAGGMTPDGFPSDEVPVDVPLHVLRANFAGEEVRPGVQTGDVQLFLAYLAMGDLAPATGGTTRLDDGPGLTGWSVFLNPDDPATTPTPGDAAAREFQIVALLSAVTERGFPVMYELQGRG